MSEPSVIQVYVFRDGEYLGSEVFAEPEISIGSGQTVDLHLNDPHVGAQHAVLHNAGAQSTLLDLGTPSGTRINHTAIQHSYVGPRDEIQIGPFTLKLKLVGAKSSIRPAAPPSAPAPVAKPYQEQETQVMEPEDTGPPRPSPLAPSARPAAPSTRPAAAAVSSRPAAAASSRPAPQAKVATHVMRDRQAAPPVDDLLAPSFEVSGSDVVASEVVPEAPARKAAPTQARREAPAPQARPEAPLGAAALPSAPQPAAPAASAGGDEDDEDEDRPAFSLVERLVLEDDPEVPAARRTALEVIAFSGDEVRGQAVLQKKGERYVLGRRNAGIPAPTAQHPGLKLVRLEGPGQAVVEFPSSARGVLLSGDQKVPLDSLKVPQNAVSKTGDVFRAPLGPQQTLTLEVGDHGFHLRFVAPPRGVVATQRAQVDPLIYKALGLAFVIHMLAGVMVAIFDPGISYSAVGREEWAELEQDDLRDVEIEPEPEPVPEPEPEPEPEETPPPEDTPAPEPEPEPDPTPRPKPKTKTQPKGVSAQEVKNAGVLGAMGKLNLAAPGKKSMVQAVSNLDAVRTPGGSNFRVGALVGKTPSSQVSVGGGGGGKLLTRGSAALLKGGEGFAKIGKRGGDAVRGTVSRVSSQRLVAKGSISREEVARVINQHLGEVQYCYERALLKSPGLKGKLVLEWTIKEDGSVGAVKQKLATLKSSDVSTCIIGKLKRWTFPKPRGGVVVVSYPFIFSSVGF
jgi:hypothetical protein